jgi:hypothetical protein
MRERARNWEVAAVLPIPLLGLLLASTAGAAPSAQGPSGVPTAAATPTSTPTGPARSPTPTGTAAVPSAAAAVVTTIPATPTGATTPSLPGPTNLQVVSSGPQPGTYTLSWTPPAGLTVLEYRVQSMPASGTPEPLVRAAGNQTGVLVRVDPRLGYAVAVVAVDTSNRVSGPSNIANTAGAPTATPIPPPPTPSGLAPYGYGVVPGTVGPGPYNGGYAPAPYAGTYGRSLYGSMYPTAPYGSAPALYGAPGYGALSYGAPGYPGYPGTPAYPGTGGAGVAQWWCTPIGGTTVVAVGQTQPTAGYTGCTYHS